MLHLLTSQVSFRRNTTEQFNDNKPNVSIRDLKEDNFSLDDEDSEWLKFCKHTYEASTDDESQIDQPLLVKLEKLMQNWTPECPDTVVYATVTEAHSGSIDDVSSYLQKLMTDWGKRLSKLCLVGGDLRDYAELKK